MGNVVAGRRGRNLGRVGPGRPCLTLAAAAAACSPLRPQQAIAENLGKSALLPSV
ncbi:hypothetical protein [Roseicella sp. DB1501]|uniref:hypothetical protein n=1 Tax=Roseicella sp. DB1501 TaxID=2730925 RepID=UPI0014921896|nr:hypothetical protein [Roseicella sp. DB1501]NOG69561.1 hypothetical protein [Roseicella sp. DB1501]